VPVLEEESFAITEPGNITVAEFDVDVEGRPLAVTVVGSDGLVPSLDVFSTDGSPIGSPIEFDSIASAVVVPHETGVHRATISGANGSVGPFELTVHALDVTEVVPGDVVDGVIARPGDLAVYRLENGDGSPVVIDVVPDPDVDVVVHVSGPDGAPATIDAGAVGATETSEVTGVGPIEVAVTSSSPGGFQLSVRPSS
jgi:hypothetical protein